MNTDGYLWHVDNEGDDEYVVPKSFTWNTSDNVDDWYDKYVDSSKPVRARGSGKSDVDFLVRYLAKRYRPSYNAAYGEPKMQKCEKLPESYEKGDLSSLLGLSKEGVCGST